MKDIAARQIGTRFMELLYVLGAVVVWFALQKWVLPKLGIRT